MQTLLEKPTTGLPPSTEANPLDLARADFWFFASFIKTKDENNQQVVPFPDPAEYRFLAELHADSERYRKPIVHKSRQVLVSWYYCARFLWKAITCPPGGIWFGAIVSKQEKDAMHLLGRVKFMYDYLPSWLKRPLENENKTDLIFGNSGIHAFPATESIGRSRTFSEILLDEMAFLPYADEMVESLQPTVADGQTKMFCVSSGNGRANLFARIVESPITNDYSKLIRIPWNRHPRRNKEWKARIISELVVTHGGSLEKAHEAFNREYDLSLEGKEGLIYDTYDEKLHVCAPFDVPGDWPMGIYIDPHPVKAAAVLLEALSPDDCLYSVDYIWETDTAANLVAKARAKWAGYANQMTTYRIDPHCDTENKLINERTNVFEEFRKHFPQMQHAPGTPERRIDAVRERLKVRPMTGRPGLRVFTNCERVRWEFLHYSTKLDLNDQPKINKIDDDFMDCKGYAAVSPPVKLLSSRGTIKYQTPAYATVRR